MDRGCAQCRRGTGVWIWSGEGNAGGKEGTGRSKGGSGQLGQSEGSDGQAGGKRSGCGEGRGMITQKRELGEGGGSSGGGRRGVRGGWEGCGGGWGEHGGGDRAGKEVEEFREVCGVVVHGTAEVSLKLGRSLSMSEGSGHVLAKLE